MTVCTCALVYTQGQHFHSENFGTRNKRKSLRGLWRKNSVALALQQEQLHSPRHYYQQRAKQEYAILECSWRQISSSLVFQALDYPMTTVIIWCPTFLMCTQESFVHCSCGTILRLILQLTSSVQPKLGHFWHAGGKLTDSSDLAAKHRTGYQPVAMVQQVASCGP